MMRNKSKHNRGSSASCDIVRTQELPELNKDPATPQSASSESRIARNATIVGLAFIVSRLLGVVREIAIAARFGTSADYDAYVAAFRIPDLLFLVVMSGAFGSAFIPVFGGFLARGDRQGAWRLASTILTYTILALSVAAVFVLIFAGPLVDIVIAPGLTTDQRQLATNLTRLLLLSPLLLGLGIAFKGILEAQEKFALAAFAPVFYNLGIIFGAIALTPAFGIYGLAIGVIIGAGLHAGIQLVGLYHDGLRLGWQLDRRIEGFQNVLRLMGPRILGQAAFQINFIVMTNFASREGTSSVGALNYAFQIFMLPYGVLALSLSTVIFPLLTRQYESGSLDSMKRTLSSSLSPLIFLSLPASVGLLFFRKSIVQVLFQIGSFDAQSTALVADSLAYFSIGLLGYAITEAITRAYYAMHDTRTPVTISVSTVALNIVLSWLLSNWLGFAGLALAISIASTLEGLLMIVVLLRRIGSFNIEFFGAIARSFAATLVFAPFAYWAGRHLAIATDPSQGRSIFTYLAFGYGLATAGAVYFGIGYVLGSAEIPGFVRRLPIVGPYAMRIIGPRYSAR